MNKAKIVQTQEPETDFPASKQKSVRKKTYVKPELKRNNLPLEVSSGQFIGEFSV